MVLHFIAVYNKYNITWLLADTKFIFSCSKIFHSFTHFSRLEEKFCISARQCNILY